MSAEMPNSLEMTNVAEIIPMTSDVGNEELMMEHVETHQVQYYVDMTSVDELAIKIDKDTDQMYVEEVAILSTEEMNNWMANENVQAVCQEETAPEQLESNAETLADVPVDRQQSENNDTVIGSESTVFQWPKPAVKELIEIYRNLQSTFQSNSHTLKKTWQQIADRLADSGWPGISATQVYSKWRGLKKQYRKIQDMGPAKNRKTWQFYDPMTKALAREQRQLDGSPEDDERPSTSATSLGHPKNVPDCAGNDDDTLPRTKRRSASRDEMPAWLRSLWTELEERRKQRRVEKQQLIALLNRLSEKL